MIYGGEGIWSCGDTMGWELPGSVRDDLSSPKLALEAAALSSYVTSQVQGTI